MSEPWEEWQRSSQVVHQSDGAYGRAVVVTIGNSKCRVCGDATLIMEVDTSDGEYSSFDCCKPCLDKLWEQYHG